MLVLLILNIAQMPDKNKRLIIEARKNNNNTENFMELLKSMTEVVITFINECLSLNDIIAFVARFVSLCAPMF